MKSTKKLTLFAVIITFVLAFSACQSNKGAGLIKRHHNKCKVD